MCSVTSPGPLPALLKWALLFPRVEEEAEAQSQGARTGPQNLGGAALSLLGRHRGARGLAVPVAPPSELIQPLGVFSAF